jgi:hypothetical protein
MFGGTAEEEKRIQHLKKLEYGKVLRNQMGSAQHDRHHRQDEHNRHGRQEEHTRAPIMENIGTNQRHKIPKIDKNAYRLDLERQIKEHKQIEQQRKLDIEQEDIDYQKNLNSVQQPGAGSERVSSSYSQNRPTSSYEPNQFARHTSITHPVQENPEQIAKNLQYQSELKAQIMGREKQKQLEKQIEKDQEYHEERKKYEEQIQLQSQFCREEGLPAPDTQGRPLDVQNRRKYFEPSSNNPIPSSGIKKAMEKSFVDPQQQMQQIQYQNASQQIESDRTNPSTIRYPAPNHNEPQMQNQNYNQQRSFEPQYNQDQPQQKFSHPPPPQNMVQNPEAQPQVNIMIEEQKKVIEMYQNTLQQIMEFQKVMKNTNKPVDPSPQSTYRI